MNEAEKTRLLRLYKLLWEQIKDEDIIISVPGQIKSLFFDDLISYKEMKIMLNHSAINAIEMFNTAGRKAFVQRMIKELENYKQYYGIKRY